MYKVLLSLILIASFGVVHAEGKGKAKASQKTAAPAAPAPAKRDASKTQEQVAWLTKLDADLTLCGVDYQMDSMSIDTQVQLLRARYSYDHRINPPAVMDFEFYDQAHKELDPKARFPACIKEARANVTNNARTYIESLVEPDLQSKAKEAIAQWMTAADAIGNKNFEEEHSKYKTLMNSLKLALQMG